MEKYFLRKAFAFMVVLSFVGAMFPLISGSSYSDITIDGELSDWHESDFLGQRNGAGFGFTWDENNLYFYWNYWYFWFFIY